MVDAMMGARTKHRSGEKDVLSPKSVKEWQTWLRANHACSSGVWLQIQKKGSAEESPTYAEALDIALCYGWIDGQKNRHDESSWLQRFTPRRPRSAWSKKNVKHAERLIQAGKMQSSGLVEIEAAKQDGRWQAAYDSQSDADMPEDFLKALRRDKSAEVFFQSLNKANLYSIAYRLQTAKTPETREKRMKMILEMLAQGKKFH